MVDDHPIILQSIVQSLTAAGMTVCASTRATEFFDNLRSSPADIAIVDLQLAGAADPGDCSDGLELLARLSAEHPTVRSIVFSADARPQTVRRCEELGVWRYLTKLSARSEDLLEAVQQTAAGEHPVAKPEVEAPQAHAFSRTSPLDAITPREREVLSFVSVGADNDAIAVRMKISERTVRAHIGNLYAKLPSANRTQLALIARRLGVPPPDGL